MQKLRGILNQNVEVMDDQKANALIFESMKTELEKASLNASKQANGSTGSSAVAHHATASPSRKGGGTFIGKPGAAAGAVPAPTATAAAVAKAAGSTPTTAASSPAPAQPVQRRLTQAVTKGPNMHAQSVAAQGTYKATEMDADCHKAPLPPSVLGIFSCHGSETAYQVTLEKSKACKHIVLQ